jgi:hypothetical protein
VAPGVTVRPPLVDVRPIAPARSRNGARGGGAAAAPSPEPTPIPAPLAALVARARQALDTAAERLRAGRTARAHAAMRRGRRVLGRLERQLGAAWVVRSVPPDAREVLRAAADALRTELTTLAR